MVKMLTHTPNGVTDSNVRGLDTRGCQRQTNDPGNRPRDYAGIVAFYPKDFPAVGFCLAQNPAKISARMPKSAPSDFVNGNYTLCWVDTGSNARTHSKSRIQKDVRLKSLSVIRRKAEHRTHHHAQKNERQNAADHPENYFRPTHQEASCTARDATTTGNPAKRTDARSGAQNAGPDCGTLHGHAQNQTAQTAASKPTATRRFSTAYSTISHFCRSEI